MVWVNVKPQIAMLANALPLRVIVLFLVSAVAMIVDTAVVIPRIVRIQSSRSGKATVKWNLVY